ncbi:MAG: YbbR-like domain-containing protein [Candidatus Azobacteroides sp.]|nr:YbbR-like domain-containing protein [Candidatus Azobacteroides sp.]
MKISIPIRFKNVPSQVALESDTPSEIDVEIKGKGTLLLRDVWGHKKDKVLELNLENLDPPKTVYTISKKYLESEISNYLSPAITLVSFTPDVLNIHYQSLKKKELPVVLSGKLTPATGYILTDTILFTPSKVFAYGLSALVDSISAIYTEDISIADIRTPIKKQIKLIVPPGINLSETNIELNVSAEEYTEKIIRVPVVCENLPENYKIHIFPSSVEIIFPVALANYGKIKEADFEAGINYFELLKSPDYTTMVNLTKKPDWIRSYRINPEVVEFLIEEKK